MTYVELRGRLLHPYWRLCLHSFGRGSVLHRPAWIRGAHQIAVGRDCVILRPQLAVAERAWERPEPALRIGDRVMMRPFASIQVSESVIIEDDVSIASFAMVSDGAAMLAQAADRVEPGPPEPIRIGRGTGIAERVAVLPGSNIGSHCFISANSVVQGEIPDCAIAVGVPARAVGSTREP